MKSTTLKQKYSALQELLTSLESVAVAFSGGVDSSLLLRVARDTLGKNVIAITADSPTCPKKDRQDAIEFAQELGVNHIIINSDEISLPEFTSNPRHRCYVCKHYRYSILMRIAHENGMAYVVDGENVDDDSDFRPGSLAAKELGVVSPLKNSGFTKADIRAKAKELGLKCWNKPAYACLASRIPYGSPIDESKLDQIDKAEAFLRDVLGCDQIRVRHHGEIARIEIDPGNISKLLDSELRSKTSKFIKQLGFTYVALELDGYKMGNLNT